MYLGVKLIIKDEWLMSRAKCAVAMIQHRRVRLLLIARICFGLRIRLISLVNIMALYSFCFSIFSFHISDLVEK